MNKEIALVTGAATGIGAEVARQLAQAGVRLVLLDVNSEAGSRLADEIGGTFLNCDVSDFASFSAAVDICREQVGAPAFAHLNAGVMTVPTGEPFLAIEDVTPEQYARIVGINLAGVYHGLKLLLPLMRDAGGGITITASTVGLGALPVDPLYAMTKHALIGLGRSVAAANAETAVRINVICPGVVDTALVPDAFRAPEFGMMPTSEMAAEILDLLQHGANGEVRVKLKEAPGFSVEPPDLDS